MKMLPLGKGAAGRYGNEVPPDMQPPIGNRIIELCEFIKERQKIHRRATTRSIRLAYDKAQGEGQDDVKYG